MNLNFFSTLSLALIIALSPFTHAEEAKDTETKRTRVPAHVMSHLGADWLERSDRDEKEQPYKVLEAMNLKPGDVVADIGVGTGYYARKIAKKVGPTGWVYGVDIQPEMLTYFNQYCERDKITNISPVLGVFDDPRLPKESLDWIILADVYHEFENPEIMLKKMRDALNPKGKICLLEYRLDGESAEHIKIDHRMSVEQVKSEWLSAGYELLKLHEFLPSQHMFIFGKKNAQIDINEMMHTIMPSSWSDVDKQSFILKARNVKSDAVQLALGHILFFKFESSKENVEKWLIATEEDGSNSYFSRDVGDLPKEDAFGIRSNIVPLFNSSYHKIDWWKPWKSNHDYYVRWSPKNPNKNSKPYRRFMLKVLPVNEEGYVEVYGRYTVED